MSAERNRNEKDSRCCLGGASRNSESSGWSTADVSLFCVTGLVSSASSSLPASPSLPLASPSSDDPPPIPAPSRKLRSNPLPAGLGPAFLLVPREALVSPTKLVQKESKIDHKASAMRSRSGVDGGGSLMLDVVGLTRRRRRGVGGRLDSFGWSGGRCVALPSGKAFWSNAELGCGLLGGCGNTSDDKMVSKRLRVFIMLHGQLGQYSLMGYLVTHSI